MRKARFTMLVIGLIALGPAVGAQAPQPPPAPGGETPREMMETGARMILQAIELMLKAIPQYEAPEVLENGDIIIRRKNAKPDAPETRPTEDGTAKTRI